MNAKSHNNPIVYACGRASDGSDLKSMVVKGVTD
jgi:hypothetical protein